jgi:hypothetical protein
VSVSWFFVPLYYCLFCVCQLLSKKAPFGRFNVWAVQLIPKRKPSALRVFIKKGAFLPTTPRGTHISPALFLNESLALLIGQHHLFMQIKTI